jgi:hypothetical protein
VINVALLLLLMQKYVVGPNFTDISTGDYSRVVVIVIIKSAQERKG